MANTTRGTFTPLNFGSQTITGYVNENQTESDKGGEVLIDNEVGDYVTQIVAFGLMTEASLDVIPASTVTTRPVVGDVFTYGVTPNIKKIVIDTIDVKRAKKDVEKWSIKGKRFPGITLP